MKRLVLTAKSLADLDGILGYITQDNPAAAVSLVEDLISTCESLRQHPELGMQRFDLASDLRVLTHRGYRIYYRNLPDRVSIARVLHHALDEGCQSFAE